VTSLTSARSRSDWFTPHATAALGPTAAASASEVVDTHYRPLHPTTPRWLPDVAARIGRLLLDAQSLAEAPAAVALWNILRDSAWAAAPEPFVSPVNQGGFSAEFERGGLHLHLEVLSNGEASVYLYDGALFEWEGDLDEVPDGIEKWAWRLGHAV